MHLTVNLARFASITGIFLLPLVSSPTFANVIGSDTQNFNPVSGTTEFVTVHSSGTLPQGRANLGLFINQATNTLPYEENSQQTRSHVNDSLVSTDVDIGIGILPRLELSFAAPFLISQTVKDDETRGEFADRGNTEIRVGLKGNLVDGNNFGLATILSSNINRTKDNPHTGTSTAPIYNLELAADNGLQPVTLGANIGYRWREPGEKIEGSLVDPISSEALASLALAVKVSSKGSVVTELYGSNALDKGANDTNRSLNTGEFLLGYKYAFNSLATGHVGAGTEVLHGLSTPDWRIYAGVVTTFGGEEEKGKLVTQKHRKEGKPFQGSSSKKIWAKPSQDPPTAEIPTKKPDETVVLRTINFEFDSDYRVMEGAFDELNRVATRLQTETFKTLVIEGHTDSMGSDDYNDDLSFRRASTVRRYMIKVFGLDEKALIAVGYGERYPVSTNETDAGRLQNRRVEIKIFKD